MVWSIGPDQIFDADRSVPPARLDIMPEPKVASFPAIRSALKFYKVASFITGVMLLLLVAEMVFKYTPLRLELFSGGSGGFLWFAEMVPGIDGEYVSVGDGTNVSTLILIAHGWFYVVYLFACFRVWSLMRWRFPRFLLLALGGVVLLLSFFLEARIERQVKNYLAARADEENTDPSAEHPQEAAR